MRGDTRRIHYPSATRKIHALRQCRVSELPLWVGKRGSWRISEQGSWSVDHNRLQHRSYRVYAKGSSCWSALAYYRVVRVNTKPANSWFSTSSRFTGAQRWGHVHLLFLEYWMLIVHELLSTIRLFTIGILYSPGHKWLKARMFYFPISKGGNVWYLHWWCQWPKGK